MRSLVCQRYGLFSDLEDTELPSPPLRPGSVRIAVSFASVSFGIGMSIAGTHQKKHAPPFIPDNEVGGIFLEVADDVDSSIIGKRVVAKVPSGAYAQEAIAPRETVYVLPDGVDLKTATALPLSYGTAFSGLFWQGEMRPGESVLIHGATGSPGLAAVQIARAAGATCSQQPQLRRSVSSLAHRAPRRLRGRSVPR